MYIVAYTDFWISTLFTTHHCSLVGGQLIRWRYEKKGAKLNVNFVKTWQKAHFTWLLLVLIFLSLPIKCDGSRWIAEKWLQSMKLWQRFNAAFSHSIKCEVPLCPYQKSSCQGFFCHLKFSKRMQNVTSNTNLNFNFIPKCLSAWRHIKLKEEKKNEFPSTKYAQYYLKFIRKSCKYKIKKTVHIFTSGGPNFEFNYSNLILLHSIVMW